MEVCERNSCVRGYHIYKGDAVIGELPIQKGAS